MAMLEEKQNELKEVSDKLENLRVHFQEKNSMKLHLESQVSYITIWNFEQVFVEPTWVLKSRTKLFLKFTHDHHYETHGTIMPCSMKCMHACIHHDKCLAWSCDVGCFKMFLLRHQNGVILDRLGELLYLICNGSNNFSRTRHYVDHYHSKICLFFVVFTEIRDNFLKNTWNIKPYSKKRVNFAFSSGAQKTILLSFFDPKVIIPCNQIKKNSDPGTSSLNERFNYFRLSWLKFVWLVPRNWFPSWGASESDGRRWRNSWLTVTSTLWAMFSLRLLLLPTWAPSLTSSEMFVQHVTELLLHNFYNFFAILSSNGPDWPGMQITLCTINWDTKKQLMVVPLVSCFFFYDTSMESLFLKTYKLYFAPPGWPPRDDTRHS